NQRHSADTRAWYAQSSSGAASLPTCGGGVGSWDGASWSYGDSFQAQRGAWRRDQGVTPPTEESLWGRQRTEARRRSGGREWPDRRALLPEQRGGFGARGVR